MVLALLPSRALFRVDQVMAARGLMAGLFGLQILLAGALSWSGSRRAWCWWWLAAAALLAITALFFPLTSWGTSDVTKLSVWFAVAPGRGTVGELSWHLVGPLISLHFRMAVGAWSGSGRPGSSVVTASDAAGGAAGAVALGTGGWRHRLVAVDLHRLPRQPPVCPAAGPVQSGWTGARCWGHADTGLGCCCRP